MINVLDWIRNPSLMIDWLRTKMGQFFTLPARIAALKVKAEQIKNIIQDRDPVSGARLSTVQADLGQIGADQTAMQARVSSLLSRLGAIGINVMGGDGMGQYSYVGPLRQDVFSQANVFGGLGIIPAIPIVIIATGGAVALGIAAIFSNYQKQERIVLAVERGSLTAAEAATLAAAARPLFALPNVGKMMVPLLLLGGLAIAAPAIRRAAR